MAFHYMSRVHGVARALTILMLSAVCVFPALPARAANVPISVLDEDQRRALVTRVQLQAGGGASLVDVLISEVPPRAHIGDPPQMLVEYLDGDGNTLGSQNAWDPLWEFTETESGEGEQLRELDQALGVFAVPLDAAIRTVRIFRQSPEDDGDDTLLITVDVSSAVDAFCAAAPADPGCASANQAPVAEAGGPYEVASGASVLLDASQSYDPEGDPLSYSWDLDEDDAFGETGASAEFGEETGVAPLFNAPVLSGNTPMEIEVVLEVCDSAEKCARDDALVRVLAASDGDADGDGIEDLADICPDTQIPEAVPLDGQLGTNRWALTTPDGFEQARPQTGKTRTFTLSDTGGCSCNQILYILGIGSDVHYSRGCPTGLLIQWVKKLRRD